MTELSDEIAAKSAILDFYSSKAVAFGGFFLAFVFGIFAMLTLVQGINCVDKVLEIELLLLSILVYIILGYGGYYALQGFYSYAEISSEIEGSLGELKNLRK